MSSENNDFIKTRSGIVLKVVDRLEHGQADEKFDEFRKAQEFKDLIESAPKKVSSDDSAEANQ